MKFSESQRRPFHTIGGNSRILEGTYSGDGNHCHRGDSHRVFIFRGSKHNAYVSELQTALPKADYLENSCRLLCCKWQLADLF